MRSSTWHASATSVRESRGLLRNVEIVGVTQIPTKEFYIVKTIMDYHKGKTEGSFTFNQEGDQLRLLAPKTQPLVI